MWSIRFYLTLLEATIVVIVVGVVDVLLIVVVYVFVVGLFVVADSIIISCDQLMFI